MPEIEEAFNLIEQAIRKANRRQCSESALKKLMAIRDALDDVLNGHDRALEEFNGSKKEYDPD